MDLTIVLVTKNGRFPEVKGVTTSDIVQNIKTEMRKKYGLKKEDTLQLKYGPSYNNPSILIDILEETDWIVNVIDFEADVMVTFETEKTRKDAIRLLTSKKGADCFDALLNFSALDDSNTLPKIDRNSVHPVILLLRECPTDAREAYKLIDNQAMKLISDQVRENPNDAEETISVNIDKRFDNPKTLAALLENGDHLFLLDKLEGDEMLMLRLRPEGGNFDTIKKYLNELPDGASAFEELRKFLH